MRFLVRWIFRLIVLVAVLGLGLLLLKDVLLTEIVQTQFRAVTGIETHIDFLRVNLLSPTITLEGVRLYDPAEFGGAPFLQLRELHVEYDPAALLHRQLHLRLLRVAVQRLVVVQSTAGRTNLVVLAPGLARLRRVLADRGFQFAGLDTLNLTLSHFERFSMRTPTQVDTTNLGVDGAIFTHLESPRDFLLMLGELTAHYRLQRVGYPFDVWLAAARAAVEPASPPQTLRP